MSFKSKFLNIITFGYLGRKAKKEAAKKTENKNDQLTLNTVDLPDITVLFNALGGSDNITKITSTISTITLYISDFNKLDFETLKDISKRGVVRSKESITLIVGDCANALKDKIIEYKNK